jgi:ankyrin repeat protein
MSEKLVVRFSNFSSIDELAQIINAGWNQKYRDEWSALYTGNFAEYQKLKGAGKKFQWVDLCGRHPMHVAALGGSVEILKDLKKERHNINVINELDGETPILCAVSAQKIEAIKFLKEQNANLNIQPLLTNNFHERMEAYGLQL